MNRVRYYIGINLATDRREVFASDRRPTYRTHGKRYVATIGPFRNLRAALWTRDNPGKRPSYRCGLNLGKTCKSRPQPAAHTISVAFGRARGVQRASGSVLPASRRKDSGSAGKMPAARSPKDRGYDAIDTVLDQVGGVPRKPRDATGRRDTLGIWAGYAEAVHAGVLKLLPPSATRPDEIAQVLGLNTAEDAWLALADAARARRGDRGTGRRELQILDRDAASAEDFGRSALCQPASGVSPEGSAGKMPAARSPVRADELSVGDTFTVQKEKFTVEFVDPDTDDVIVQDGVRFGKQTLLDNAVLCPDPGSLVRAAALATAGASPF